MDRTIDRTNDRRGTIQMDPTFLTELQHPSEDPKDFSEVLQKRLVEQISFAHIHSDNFLLDKTGPLQPGYGFYKWLGRRSGLNLRIPETLVVDGSKYLWLTNDPKTGCIRRVPLGKDKERWKKQFKEVLKAKADPIGNEEKGDVIVALLKRPVWKEHLMNRTMVISQGYLHSTIEDITKPAGDRCVLQHFVKCRGGRATVHRVVWHRKKSSFTWSLSNLEPISPYFHEEGPPSRSASRRSSTNILMGVESPSRTTGLGPDIPVTINQELYSPPTSTPPSPKNTKKIAFGTGDESRRPSTVSFAAQPIDPSVADNKGLLGVASSGELLKDASPALTVRSGNSRRPTIDNKRDCSPALSVQSGMSRRSTADQSVMNSALAPTNAGPSMGDRTTRRRTTSALTHQNTDQTITVSTRAQRRGLKVDKAVGQTYQVSAAGEGVVTLESAAKMAVVKMSGAVISELKDMAARLVIFVQREVFRQTQLNLLLDTLAVDFIKDEAGDWWFLQVKNFELAPEAVPRVLEWHRNKRNKKLNELVGDEDSEKLKEEQERERRRKEEAMQKKLYRNAQKCPMCGLWFFAEDKEVDENGEQVSAWGYHLSAKMVKAMNPVLAKSGITYEPIQLEGQVRRAQVLRVCYLCFTVYSCHRQLGCVAKALAGTLGAHVGEIASDEPEPLEKVNPVLKNPWGLNSEDLPLRVVSGSGAFKKGDYVWSKSHFPPETMRWRILILCHGLLDVDLGSNHPLNTHNAFFRYQIGQIKSQMDFSLRFPKSKLQRVLKVRPVHQARMYCCFATRAGLQELFHNKQVDLELFIRNEMPTQDSNVKLYQDTEKRVQPSPGFMNSTEPNETHSETLKDFLKTTHKNVSQGKCKLPLNSLIKMHGDIGIEKDDVILSLDTKYMGHLFVKMSIGLIMDDPAVINDTLSDSLLFLREGSVFWPPPHYHDDTHLPEPWFAMMDQEFGGNDSEARDDQLLALFDVKHHLTNKDEHYEETVDAMIQRYKEATIEADLLGESNKFSINLDMVRQEQMQQEEAKKTPDPLAGEPLPRDELRQAWDSIFPNQDGSVILKEYIAHIQETASRILRKSDFYIEQKKKEEEDMLRARIQSMEKKKVPVMQMGTFSHPAYSTYLEKEDAKEDKERRSISVPASTRHKPRLRPSAKAVRGAVRMMRRASSGSSADEARDPERRNALLKHQKLSICVEMLKELGAGANPVLKPVVHWNHVLMEIQEAWDNRFNPSKKMWQAVLQTSSNKRQDMMSGLMDAQGECHHSKWRRRRRLRIYGKLFDALGQPEGEPVDICELYGYLSQVDINFQERMESYGHSLIDQEPIPPDVYLKDDSPALNIIQEGIGSSIKNSRQLKKKYDEYITKGVGNIQDIDFFLLSEEVMLGGVHTKSKDESLEEVKKEDSLELLLANANTETDHNFMMNFSTEDNQKQYLPTIGSMNESQTIDSADPNVAKPPPLSIGGAASLFESVEILQGICEFHGTTDFYWIDLCCADCEREHIEIEQATSKMEKESTSAATPSRKDVNAAMRKAKVDRSVRRASVVLMKRLEDIRRRRSQSGEVEMQNQILEALKKNEGHSVPTPSTAASSGRVSPVRSGRASPPRGSPSRSSRVSPAHSTALKASAAAAFFPAEDGTSSSASEEEQHQIQVQRDKPKKTKRAQRKAMDRLHKNQRSMTRQHISLTSMPTMDLIETKQHNQAKPRPAEGLGWYAGPNPYAEAMGLVVTSPLTPVRQEEGFDTAANISPSHNSPVVKAYRKELLGHRHINRNDELKAKYFMKRMEASSQKMDREKQRIHQELQSVKKVLQHHRSSPLLR